MGFRDGCRACAGGGGLSPSPLVPLEGSAIRDIHAECLQSQVPCSTPIPGLHNNSSGLLICIPLHDSVCRRALSELCAPASSHVRLIAVAVGICFSHFICRKQREWRKKRKNTDTQSQDGMNGVCSPDVEHTCVSVCACLLE